MKKKTTRKTKKEKFNRKKVYLSSVGVLVAIFLIGVVSFSNGGDNKITMLTGSSVASSLSDTLTAIKVIPTLGIDSGEALFDVTLTIPEKSEVIHPGDSLLLSVELVNFGTNTDTSITYIVTKEKGGDIVYVEHEDRVVEAQDQFLKTLELQELPYGNYNVYAHLLYGEATAIASGEFMVTLS